jgi:hypothetical protein
MKKSSATIYSPSMELPVITRKFSRRVNRKVSASTPVETLSNAVPPPTEEMLSRLNKLGQEYPFCVYYKQKAHDPL